MGVTTWIAVIAGLIKFWDEIKSLIKSLQSTPEEQQAALLEHIRKEAENFKATNRPNWD